MSSKPQLYIIVGGQRRLPPPAYMAWRDEVTARVQSHQASKEHGQTEDVDKPSALQSVCEIILLGLAMYGALALCAYAMAQ